ncbi:tol-pal system protein YbgF [Polystyrenella longa]|uniref:Tol-pal system protein YbgF n=1 Tax=Polystyrenella longa TaxID=2528007 RepID=A0A518CGK6_9PLAN|nr:tetratricopeptide repeat protein [Polystyrenella longa]QDU78358.1 tol-pal system protein YbgF [Polystyrenella longa]
MKHITPVIRSLNAPRFTWAFSLIVLSCLNVSAQDRITRSGGDKPILGKIKEMTNEVITIETKRDGVVKVTPNQIEEIKWDDEPARFSAGRSLEEKGYFPRAFEAYEEALADLDAGLPMIKTDIEYHLLHLKANMAMSGATLPNNQTSDQLITEFKTFLDQHKNSYVYYPGLMILGKLAHQQGKPEALDYFVELQKTPWNDYQILGFTAQGHQQLAAGEIDTALATFEKALAIPSVGKADELARAEAILGKAATLVAQNKTVEALPMIEQLIENSPDSAPGTQARIYLTQGKLFQQLGRNEEAVVSLLHVDILYPQSAPEHAEALYHLTKLWAALGQPDRAATTIGQLNNDYPDSRWTAELNKN